MNFIYRESVNNSKKYNKEFNYYYDNNIKVSKKDLTRILNLKIPPNWTDVQVSTSSKTSIQATGLDSKQRKQYIYHELHIKRAEEQKFIRLYDFVKSMKKLDIALKRHAKLEPYNYYKVISTMLILVRDLHMRVGKEIYARVNKSYGVSSIRKKHVNLTNANNNLITFKFKGKSNVRLSYSLRDELVIHHIKLLMKLSGDRLFQYLSVDKNNENKDKIRAITDLDLNQYVQKYMGEQFTVKDFRTYSSNYYFIMSLLKETKLHNNNIKENIKNAIKKSSFYLKHTKAISKKSYVLNFIIDMYENNVSYFIKHKQDETKVDLVMLDILKKYKKNILKLN
jgi:DNA topoisomerase-1